MEYWAILSGIEGNLAAYVLWLAIIIAPARNQGDFGLTLFATIGTLWLRLTATRLTLFATGAQSSISAHFICK
jgi:ABC-type Fe3+-siderophore transport system permease subunit